MLDILYMYGAAFAAKRYRETQDSFASPNDILLRLLAGAIGFIDSAKTAVEKKDFQRKSHCIGRAIAIIDELANPLASATDEPSRNVLRLYKFCRDKLLEGSVQMKTKPLDEARKIVVEVESIFTTLISRG